MTRDEIKNTPELVDFLIDESVIADSRKKVRKRMDEICNLAIKALEQEPILDKIRDEIEYKQIIQLKGEDVSEWNKCIKEVLEVIDKYKAESEDKE